MSNKEQVTNWKQTLLQSKRIKWKPLKVKNIEDNKMDFILTMPFTNLFEAQAKVSFMHGMMLMLTHLVDMQLKGESTSSEKLAKLFNDAGIPEVAKQIELNKIIGNKTDEQGEVKS